MEGWKINSLIRDQQVPMQFSNLIWLKTSYFFSYKLVTQIFWKKFRRNQEMTANRSKFSKVKVKVKIPKKISVKKPTSISTTPTRTTTTDLLLLTTGTVGQLRCAVDCFGD